MKMLKRRLGRCGSLGSRKEGGDGMGKERRKTSPETRRERRGEGRKKRRRDVDEKRTVKETETGR